MLTENEKIYITEHYVGWKQGRFRYWESLPQANLNDPQSLEWAEASQNKPPLIFIHGYGGLIEHWRRTFTGLKGRYRLYALDLLGFGFSEKKSGNQINYSAELWAKQVRDLLIHKNEKKAIIVGHSLGGMVAIQFARQYPEMVEALVLVDSAGLPDQGNAEIEGARQQSGGKRGGRFDFGVLAYNAIKAPLLGEAAALALGFSSDWAARATLKNSYYNQAKVTDQLVEQFRAPLRTPNATLAFLAITRNFATYQLPIQPGDLTMPTLIMWGQYDRSMPPDIMLPRWQKLIPQAETFVVSDSGHCPQDERPDILNPRLIQFVEQLVASKKSEPVNQL